MSLETIDTAIQEGLQGELPKKKILEIVLTSQQ